MDPFLQKAREQKIPAYLEAISERTRDMYLHFGWTLAEGFRVGVGVFNEAGEWDDKGEGMPFYAMIYWP